MSDSVVLSARMLKKSHAAQADPDENGKSSHSVSNQS